MVVLNMRVWKRKRFFARTARVLPTINFLRIIFEKGLDNNIHGEYNKKALAGVTRE